MTKDGYIKAKVQHTPKSEAIAKMAALGKKKVVAKKMESRRDQAKYFYAKQAHEHRTYKKRMGLL